MKKNQALLMDLETRGPKAFNAFIESLIEAGQDNLAKLLGYDPSLGPAAQASTPHEEKPAPFGLPPQQQHQPTSIIWDLTKFL